MKKKVLSLFLALLMVLAVVPMAAFSVGAGEVDLESKTYTYKDLYVTAGLTALFVGYQNDASVSIENGSGTWTNLVAGGKDAAINGNVVTEWGGSKTYTAPAEGNTEVKFHTHYVFEYDKNGTPVAVREVNLYEEQGTAAFKATQTITIDGVKHYLTKAETFYKSVIASNAPLYVKDLAVTANQQSYTTNGGDLTWTLVSTTEEEGYVSLGNYKIGGNLSFTAGGWTAGNGITTSYNDLYVMKTDPSKNLIDFGTMGDLFGRTDDYDYTLEVIADYAGFADGDNYAFTLENTANEGEGRWSHGLANCGPVRLGRWVDNMRSSSPNRLPSGQGMYNVYVTYWQGGHTNLYAQDSRMGYYNTQGVSGIHNYTYLKAADGNGSARFELTLDGITRKAFVPGVDKYSGALDGSRESVYEGNDASMRAYVMAGMAGTVYAIRAYDRTLNLSEIDQNHFADLCGYYGVSSEAITRMMGDKEVFNAILGKFGSYKLGETSKEEIENSIDEAFANKEAVAEIAKYAALYAEGATVLLNAYNTRGVVALDKSGNGSWKNLIDGLNVKLEGSLGAAKSAKETYSFGRAQLEGATLGYTAAKITYAEDGTTPLYLTQTEYYVADTNGGHTDNGKCKPIKINGGALQYVSHQVYTSYKWVEDASVTTYIKTVDMWEKMAGSFHVTDKWMDLSDTEITGATKRTRVEFTTTTPADMTGWVAIEGGKFVEDNLNEYFGGWHDNGNSVSVDMADVALMSRKGNTRIVLDPSYVPAIDSEFTLEIVSKITPAIDTDNSMNTFGYNFNYEGELNRMQAFQMGGFTQYWGVVSSIYPNPSAMYSTNYFVYPYQGADTPVVNGTAGRSNVQVTLSGSSDYVDQVYTVTYDKVKDGEAFDIIQSVAYGSAVRTATPYNDITVTQANTAEFYLLKNVPNITYSIRLYNHALNSAEKAQNHFADLCAYFKLDISKILELKEAGDDEVLSMIYSTAQTYTFTNTTANALAKMIDDAIIAAEARRTTMKYAGLYAEDAAVILMAYNAVNDGSIVLDNGSGTWTNLVDGATFEMYGETSSFTGLDGVDYTTGWKLGDKSVGFEMSWQSIKSHGIKVPSSYLGDEYTVEMVANVTGLHVNNSGSLGVYHNVDNSTDEGGGKTFTKGDKPELWADIMLGKNLQMHYKLTAEYDGENMMQLLPPGELYTGYHENGNNGGGPWFGNTGIGGVAGKIANYFVTEDLSEDATKVDLRWQAYSASTVIAALGRTDANPNGITVTKDVYASEGSTVTLFSNLPADVYAIRVYNRVLNETERLQNHFADLAAYFMLDIDALKLLDEDDMVGIYEAFANYTIETADVATLQAALDEETASASPLQFRGIAGRLEDYAALRGTFSFDETLVATLAEKELTVVDYGAMVAIADGIDMTDLTVTYDADLGTITADASVIGMVSANAGMAYNYAADGIGKVFTLAVTYGNLSDAALKAAYETDLIYRGFLVLTDADGLVYTLYANGTTDAFGDTASMKDVASALLADAEYAGNEILQGVVDACAETPAE